MIMGEGKKRASSDQRKRLKPLHSVFCNRCFDVHSKMLFMQLHESFNPHVCSHSAMTTVIMTPTPLNNITFNTWSNFSPCVFQRTCSRKAPCAWRRVSILYTSTHTGVPKSNFYRVPTSTVSDAAMPVNCWNRYEANTFLFSFESTIESIHTKLYIELQGTYFGIVF